MTDAHLLRIGSRASPLARTQAEWVSDRLACCTALVWMRSGGDQDRTTPLHAFGNTGVFTAEVNQALRDDRIDAAVHSLKDLPAIDEPGLVLGCVPIRENVHDALIARDGLEFAALPAGARVGTGSPRRVAQLRRARPDLEFVGIRGNVDTRIRHIEEGKVDAVVLALAGLRRLAKQDLVTQVLPVDLCLPAAAQGALGIVIRAGDACAETSLAPIKDVSAAACVAAERTALHGLGAGCHTPVGALGIIEGGRLRLHVRVLSADGTEMIETELEGPMSNASALGAEAATILLAQGAERLVTGS